MQSPTYFSGLVKIIENPKSKFYNQTILKTTTRGLLPQVNKTKPSKIVNLTYFTQFRGQIQNLTQINQYILIEGYISINQKKNVKLRKLTDNKLTITVLKVYPFI